MDIFYPGQSLRFDGLEIRFSLQDHLPERILVSCKLPITYIEIGSGIDIKQDLTDKRILDCLFAVGKAVAEPLLLPKAQEIAKSRGVSPKGWRISKARKRALGTCNSRGVISFSPLLVFLPERLRESIICHELAHLAHFNHSAKFHSLCNSFSLKITGQSEKEHQKALRAIFRDKKSIPHLLTVTS